MIDVVIVRSNSIIYSPRVRKIAKSLDKRYSVVVLGWNREGVKKELSDSFIVKLKLLGLRAPFGKTSLIVFFPIFWIWTFMNLVVLRPRVVHACDLDAVIPSYIYNLIFRKKLVFDVCDRYAMAYISPEKWLYDRVNRLEEYFVKHSDVLLTVGEELMDSFNRKANRATVIMNCFQDDEIFAARYHSPPNEMEPMESKSKPICASHMDNVFSLVYSGNIVKRRGLEKIASIVEELPNLKLIIAGKPIDTGLLESLMQSPKIEYLGLLQPGDVLNVYRRSDAMIILYDPRVPNNIFSMSNKLFEAMMCSIPVITNVASKLVQRVGCGIVVDYNDHDEIRKAIVSLRDDPLLHSRLGVNGRKAFLNEYNWNLMESKMLNIYESLLKAS